MKNTLFSAMLLTLGFAGVARGTDVFYGNTTTDTTDTFFFSVGPYTALGDQIHLISTGLATAASVEMFNAGDAGTFDASLNFFNASTNVLLGTFNLTGINSAGMDVIDFTFNLGAGLAVPQDLVFTLSVSNLSPNMDLGVDMFEPPEVGSSDNSFMIAATSGLQYFQLGTTDENVFFELVGQADGGSVPEPSSVVMVGLGIAGIAYWRRSDLKQFR